MSGASFEVLPWDSGLFGFSVARLMAPAWEGEGFEGALASLRSQGVSLAYAALPWEDTVARSRLDAAGAFLADHKVRFRKALSGGPEMPPGVEAWTGACTPDLEALALASGHQSRFLLDPRVPRQVFPDLYRTWIRRSVLREIADEVLVVLEGEGIAGFVTLAEKEGIAEIGLIAVHASQRGRGLGRRLMAASETWALGRGASAMEVVTQGANEGACALYTACGYALAKEEAVYHVWMEPAP